MPALVLREGDILPLDEENGDMGIAKCDGCGKAVIYKEWPKGWIKTGVSRYGTGYDKEGIGWWCPVCGKDI